MAQTALMGLAPGIAFLPTKRALWGLGLAHARGDTLPILQLYLGGGNT